MSQLQYRFIQCARCIELHEVPDWLLLFARISRTGIMPVLYNNGTERVCSVYADANSNSLFWRHNVKDSDADSFCHRDSVSVGFCRLNPVTVVITTDKSTPAQNGRWSRMCELCPMDWRGCLRYAF